MRQPPYQAPDFSLKSPDGKTYSLKDYAGKWLVLYFYPEDDTPGCTIQACSMRDARDDIMTLGAEVVGISRDDASSHELFKAKHSLNFTLLSDPDLKTIKAYDVWGKKMFGNEGVRRRTFIINPKQVVVKVYGRVTVIGHGEQIISELKRLQNSSAA